MSTVARARPLLNDAVAAEVLAGLTSSPRQLPCKLFYDEAGAALFERICTLPEYYPTRTELAILRAHAAAMAKWIGTRARIVEFGSGSGDKTRLLLRALRDVAEYVPIDIADRQLEGFSRSLRLELPDLRVRPIHADYTQPLSLGTADDVSRTVVFFPGSTIGNFHPHEALRFLRNTAGLSGRNGGLLIGVDLKKHRRILEPAYDDAQGITAAFNLNILAHVNRICDADFDTAAFRHRAIYNEPGGRIEMHLVSTVPQRVTLARSTTPRHIMLSAGEAIVTEYSYKYSVEEFCHLAMHAGYSPEEVWQDRDHLFAVIAFNRGISGP